jgi:hypothetical protein
MPARRGNRYVQRLVTLNNELDDALMALSKDAGKSPSEVIRVILGRDPGIAAKLRTILQEKIDA